MNQRNLGESDLIVSELCFGTMTFTGDKGWRRVGSTEQQEADRLIGICLDAGVNFFDTANIYSDGAAETILGNALGSRRHDVVIASKVGYRTAPGPDGTGCSRGHILRACDESLRRLNTDYIDLYIIHAYDPAVPLEETMKVLDDLVGMGKVRHIGCSNFTGWQLMKANAISEKNGWRKFINAQVLYNLVQRDVEYEIVPACLDQKMGVTVWGALAGGFLSGKYRKDRPWPVGTRMKRPGAHHPFDEEQGYRVIDEMIVIAREYAVSESQVALNWLLNRPGVSSLVIGARDERQLIDNLNSQRWQLSEEKIHRLDLLSEPAQLYPRWYNEVFRRERMR